MSGNNNWGEKEILPEVMAKSQEKLKGYYCWRLNTIHENYAHIFVCEMKDEKDLMANWNNITNLIAVYIQSEVESLLQRSNFYVWFFCGAEISQSVQKSIEDDTFSSKKYIVVEEKTESEEGKIEEEKRKQERLEIIEKKLFAYKYKEQMVSGKMVQKVVMKNFRTYRGERIFDFAYGEKPAQLIVLFAPNGMGKTSFFDGVEWVLTESIDRFGKIGNKNVDGSILKNIEVDSKEEASVVIYMESGEWVKRKVSDLNNRTRKDIGKGNVSFSKGCNLKPIVGNSKIWSNIILQHHKIDGFIAAANPQELYKEWCGLWDPSGEERKYFEQSYKGVKNRKDNLQRAIEKYDEIKDEYEEINKKRDFVEELEGYIKEFNGLLCENKLAVPDFLTITPEEYMKWTDRVDCQVDNYEIRKHKLEVDMWYFETMFEDDVNNYMHLSKHKKELESKLLEVEKNIEFCQKKKELLALQSNFEQQITSVNKDIQRLSLITHDQNWYRQAKDYFEALSNRNILRDRVYEAKEKLFSEIQNQEKLKLDLSERRNNFKEQREYHLLSNHLNEIQRLKKEMGELEEEIKSVEKKIASINSGISEYTLKQERFRNKYLKSFDNVLERYHAFGLQQREGESDLEIIRGDLVERLRIYLELGEEIKRIDHRILEEENLGTKLQKILKDVRKLIEERKLKKCPVCHNLFDDSEQLLQHTYYMDSAEGERLKRQRKEQEKKLIEESHVIEGAIIAYNLQLDRYITEADTSKMKEKELLDSIQRTYEELQIQHGIRKDTISQIIKKDQEEEYCVVYTEEGVENWRHNWEKRQMAEIMRLEDQLKEAEGHITYHKEQIIVLERTLKENETVILNMESSSHEHFILMQKEKDIITNYSYEELQRIIIDKEEKREMLSKQLSKCDLDLQKYLGISEGLQQTFIERKDVLQTDIKNNSTDRDSVIERIKKSEMLSGKIEDLEYIKNEEWKSDVKKRVETLQDEQENIAKATEILNKMKYNREIENYFQKNREVARQLLESETEKEKKKEELKKAEERYRDSREKIERNLREFFDTFQINDIYEKLQPHDTLKTLTCKFDFNEDDKPELSFQVVGKDHKPYAPEWYFSTAQLNVVAFSVFLGKVLQSAEVPIQSIFIDDPVGHFDEMNIVCFVDLLRNIVENTNRQLILSTHEERVFGLIQRKMPKDEYPVCYIDFREGIGG